MKDSDVIKELASYKSAGNYFIVYKVIKENSKSGVCELTQDEIGNILKKTRQFVSSALKVLERHKLIKFSYRKIEVL